MARLGVVAALALLLAMTGLTARATVIACPGSEIITGEASGAGATRSDAVSDAESKADSAKASMAADLSCKVATPPCSLQILAIDSRIAVARQANASWRVRQGWRYLAACHGGPAAGRSTSRVALPPAGPTSRTAGAGGAGAGSGVAPAGGPAPPLANCDCPQLPKLLSELQADLAKAEAEERALTGKIKSAQVLGQPTGALEAALAANLNEQAALRAQIKVVRDKLKHCPQSCQQSQGNLPPQQGPNPLPPAPAPR